AKGEQAKRLESAASDGESFRVDRLANSRYGIVYDIDGPRVRLGLAWFVAAVVAVYLGLFVLAVLVGAIAALASAQTAKALRTKWQRPHLAVAALIGGAIPLAAAAGVALAGATIIVGALVAIFAASSRQPRRTDPLVDAGAVLRSSVFVGLAAASVVVLYRFDIGAAVMLILMLSAYESGDYLIGSGATNVVEGPFSGLLAVIVVTGAAAVVQPPPFHAAGLWLYAMVAAASAPVGQVLASAILPRAGAPAPALRRLDSYLVTGPAWLVLLWSDVGI
ncbi:MAG: hypothetical protein ACLFRV_02895, partial [Acidimicrobiales bacterium]